MANPIAHFYAKLLGMNPTDFRTRKYAAATLWFLIGIAVGFVIADL